MMKEKLVIIILLLFTLLSYCQVQNISGGQVFDGEPYISINPYNSQHMVVAWMSWEFPYRISIKTRVSFNGGNTWTKAQRIPHIVSTYTSADVSIAFDHQEHVFLSFIDYTGYEVEPLAGGIYCTQSIDGGLNWQAAVEVLQVDDDPGKRPIDRPWISIDRSAGVNQGNIYITSMNAKDANPDFHPYFMKSTNGGMSFEPWKFLDDHDWLAGNLIAQPMPTNCISSNGDFHAIYPSYVLSQDILPQFIIASSTDAGENFSYHHVFHSIHNPDDSLSKKAYLIRSNPSNPSHLAFFYFDISNGDMDLFLRESFNSGETWSDSQKINDDDPMNHKMQDLVWADFDDDGDLLVAWRDRRNGLNDSYSTASEIWASYRPKDSLNFQTNFRISDSLVAYDEILAFSGNDFMCVKLRDDTLNAVWGDTRDGKLNIWFRKMDINGHISSTIQLNNEKIIQAKVYPNPFNDIIHVQSQGIEAIFVYNLRGEIMIKQTELKGKNNIHVNLTLLQNGSYFVKTYTVIGVATNRIIKIGK